MTSVKVNPRSQYYTTAAAARQALGVPQSKLRFLRGLGYYTGAAPHTTGWTTMQSNQAPTINSLLSQYQGTFLSPKQQGIRARQDVNSEINTALAGIRASTAAEQKQARDSAARAQNYALALSEINRADPAEIAAQYRQSANAIEGYGTGLSGSVEQAQQQEASQAADQIAQQGVGKFVQTVDPALARSTNILTGATMPAASLQQQAANAYATALQTNKAQPAALERVRDEYIKRGQQEQFNLALQVAALEKTRPDLYQKAIAGYRDAGRNDMSTLITALTLQNQTRTAGAGITGVDPTTGQFAKDTWQDPKTGTVYTIPAGWHVSADGKKLVPPPAKSPTGGPFVPGTRKLNTGYWWSSGKVGIGTPQKIPTGYVPNDDLTKITKLGPKPGTKPSDVKTVQQTINSVRSGVTKAVGSDAYSRLVNPLLPNLGRVPTKKWGEAVNGLLSYFPKQYRKDPRVLSMIYDALTSVGYKKPAATTPVPPGKAGPGTGKAGPGIPKGWVWDPTTKKWRAP